MKVQTLKTKQKSIEKLKNKNKINIPKQQPLPEYLCQSTPVFYQNQKSISEYYFNQFQFLEEDNRKCKDLLVQYIQAEKQTERKVEELRQFTCNEDINFKSGLPFYSCKNIIFNEYLICLKMYELFRLNSADFTTGPGLSLYQRLVYLKTLILKLGPVQKKLEYQKNKLLKKGQKIKIKQYNQRAINQQQKVEQKQASSQSEEEQQQINNNQKQQQPQGEQGEQDNLVYKPMLKNLISNHKNKADQKQKQGKYIAPKLSAVLPAQQKVKRRQERQNERRKAHLLRKFRGDIQSGDQAQEKDMLEGIDPRFKKRYQQKLRFEEENFTRLNETKKQKYWKKQMLKNRFNNSLNDEIKQIEMIRELVNDEQVKGNKRQTPIGAKQNIQKSHPKKKRKID